jgi:hypothetical protein
MIKFYLNKKNTGLVMNILNIGFVVMNRYQAIIYYFMYNYNLSIFLWITFAQ